MEKVLKLNQCQDCGCPGAKLIIEVYDDSSMAVKCPYCGRKGKTFVMARKMAKSTPWKLAEVTWNPYNRDNKEGLV